MCLQRGIVLRLRRDRRSFARHRQVLQQQQAQPQRESQPSLPLRPCQRQPQLNPLLHPLPRRRRASPQQRRFAMRHERRARRRLQRAMRHAQLSASRAPSMPSLTRSCLPTGTFLMARRRRRASLVFVIHVDSNGCRVQCCELSEARCGRRHGACHQGRRRSPAYRPEGRQGALRVRFISYGCCFGYSMLCFGYPSCVLVCLCCLTGVTGRRTIARHRRCNDSAGWTVRGRVSILSLFCVAYLLPSSECYLRFV